LVIESADRRDCSDYRSDASGYSIECTYSKMKAIRRLQFYQLYLRDEVGLWKNKNTGKSGQQLMCNLNQVGREGKATFHLEI